MPKKKKVKKSKPVKRKAAPKPKPKPKKKSKTAKASVSPAKSSRAAKKPASKKSPPPPLAPRPPLIIPGEKFLGKIEDFFGKISVIALTLKESLSLGDIIHVLGHTTDFTQKVESMQIESKPVKAAVRKDSVGIKVSEKARKGDNVYRVG